MAATALQLDQRKPAAVAARPGGVGGHSLLPSASLPSLSHEEDAVFYRSREPHPDWVRALEEISPPSSVHGYLRIVWEPGDPWIPGQRWTLYEFVRIDLEVEYKGRWELALDDETLEDLHGPHPRSTGHMCADRVPTQFQCLCRRKLNAWKGGPTARITLRQYQLFKETGMFANPFWIIQGGNGGHLAGYDAIQRKMLQQEGLPTEPPSVGELPFAEFDARVLHQIRQFNRLHAMGNNIAEYRRTMGADYGAYKAGIEKEMRRQWVRYLANQTREEAADFIDAERKGEMDHIQKTDIDWERVDDLATQDFIETGSMNRTSSYLPRLS